MPRPLARLLGIAAITLGLSILAPLPALADADVDDFQFSSFDADYYLERADDGSSRLRTVETLVAEFPDVDQNRGIIRAIPTDDNGADVGLSITSVTDGDGAPVPFEESDDDGFRELALGTDDFVRGTQTYVIEYEKRNVVRAYDDTEADEFYWDTNGTGFEQPFGTLSARVHIPGELAATLTGNTACYRGGEGATDDCAIDESTDAGETVFAVQTADLGPGENVTVAIGFDQGTFAEPTRARDAPSATVVPIVAAVVSLLGLLGALIARATRWRDARGRGIRIAQYTPPDGIDLMQAADLVDRRSTAIPAQIVSFAVRGNIRIIDTGDPSADLTGAGEQYILEFLSDRDVTDGERALLHVLFGPTLQAGDERMIGASRTDIGAQLRARLTGLQALSVERGLRHPARPRERAVVAGIGIAIAVLALVTIIVMLSLNAVAPVFGLLFLAAGLGVGTAFLCVRKPVLTEAGAALRDHLLGIREYLLLAEADRFRMLQSETGADRRVDPDDARQVVRLNEKLMPFAVLWGIERSWAEELDRLYSGTGETPDWYRGESAFNPVVFVGIMSSINAQSAATATPSSSAWTGSATSSSFGGSMGGGFSGGGGGGGGGGGR